MCFLSRSFTSLCYSADGDSVLAGGLSKFVCIYNVREQLLVKKFEISTNLSFDAMEVRNKQMFVCLTLRPVEVLLRGGGTKITWSSLGLSPGPEADVSCCVRVRRRRRRRTSFGFREREGELLRAVDQNFENEDG